MYFGRLYFLAVHLFLHTTLATVVDVSYKNLDKVRSFYLEYSDRIIYFYYYYYFINKAQPLKLFLCTKNNIRLSCDEKI